MMLCAFPAFAALNSAWLFGEKISTAGWLCLEAVMSGVAILVDPSTGGELAGYAGGVLSAVFARLTMAIMRQLKQTSGAVVVYLYFCAVGAAATAPCGGQNPGDTIPNREFDRELSMVSPKFRWSRLLVVLDFQSF